MDAQDVFSDAEKFSGTSKQDMEDVSVLCNRLREMDEELEAMDSTLKAMRKKRQAVMLDLAAAMQDANMSKFETADGKTVKLVKTLRASIPKSKAEEAEAWLVEHGHADIIKYTIEASLDRGQHNMAGDIVAKLKEDYGIDASSLASVHASTLSAFVREQTGKGVDLPEDLLGIYMQMDVKVG